MGDDTLIDRLRIDRDAVREEQAGRRWPVVVLIIALVLAAAAAAWWFATKRAPMVETVRPQTAETGASAGQASVLDASGYVVARRQAAVSAEVTGKLEEVLIEEGMQVEKGQVIARLNDETERARLDLSRARLSAAESALAELRVQLDDARRTLRRQEELNRRDLVSQSEVDRAETNARSLEARLASRESDVEVARQEVRLQEQLVDELTVRAPFSGVVVAQTAEVGEMISPVSAGGGFTRTGVGTIVDMDSLEIEVDVNESYIDRVETGQSVVARLDAYPDWRIPAEVKRVVPSADRDKATVRVRVELLEKDSRILPDMGVSVRFLEGGAETGANEQALMRVQTVPESAVYSASGNDYVLVVDSGRIERRAVRTGAREGGRVVITAGLAGNERLVANPGETELEDGEAVRVAGDG
ncbi:MAG: efflux RND transporter periplasmic adaptor subunit [Gammaproteobacteria bacterium]|jgi:RND family efflux transporter MFP subunit|nr:efflux RND transporter periplasmic adaptor subunit [Gammaproteobacteria bacterium]